MVQTKTAIIWKRSAFDKLPNSLLYAILKLRETVFHVEQHCIYEDLDGLDFYAQHLCGFDGDTLIAYTRIFEPSDTQPFFKFGRVAVSPTHRGQGLGKALLKETLSVIDQHPSRVSTQISAQRYLQAFYESFGFESRGDVYLEDGIEHVLMERGVI